MWGVNTCWSSFVYVWKQDPRSSGVSFRGAHRFFDKWQRPCRTKKKSTRESYAPLAKKYAFTFLAIWYFSILPPAEFLTFLGFTSICYDANATPFPVLLFFLNLGGHPARRKKKRRRKSEYELLAYVQQIDVMFFRTILCCTKHLPLSGFQRLSRISRIFCTAKRAFLRIKHAL